MNRSVNAVRFEFNQVMIGQGPKNQFKYNLVHKPVFVVVFMGGAVKLISSNRSDFNPEDIKYLKEIADTVSGMSKDGIKLEVCLAAVRLFGVDPSSIQSEINKVGNGWISEIGYQAQGYSLVPVY